MPDQVHRTTADRLNDASDVAGQIVQGRAVERTATASDATHIDRDRLEPSGNQRARQMIKIAGATARIREQHDWCAQTTKCAVQRRVTDVDASMLLQSHLLLLLPTGRDFPCRAGHAPRDHPTLAPNLTKRGRTAPQIPPSDVVEGGRYRWPKPDSIPKRASVLRSDSEYHRVHVVGLCGMRPGAPGARSGMTGGSIPAFTPPVFTAVRSVRCAPPGPPMFRSSRRPRRPKRRVSVPACGAGLRPLRSAAHGSAAGRQLKERCGLSSRTARSMGRGLPSNASLCASV